MKSLFIGNYGRRAYKPVADVLEHRTRATLSVADRWPAGWYLRRPPVAVAAPITGRRAETPSALSGPEFPWLGGLLNKTADRSGSCRAELHGSSVWVDSLKGPSIQALTLAQLASAAY